MGEHTDKLVIDLEKRVSDLEGESTSQERRIQDLEVNEKLKLERHNTLESRMSTIEGRQARVESILLEIQMKVTDGVRATSEMHAELHNGIKAILKRLSRLEPKGAKDGDA